MGSEPPQQARSVPRFATLPVAEYKAYVFPLHRVVVPLDDVHGYGRECSGDFELLAQVLDRRIDQLNPAQSTLLLGTLYSKFTLARLTMTVPSTRSTSSHSRAITSDADNPAD